MDMVERLAPWKQQLERCFNARGSKKVVDKYLHMAMSKRPQFPSMVKSSVCVVTVDAFENAYEFFAPWTSRAGHLAWSLIDFLWNCSASHVVSSSGSTDGVQWSTGGLDRLVDRSSSGCLAAFESAFPFVDLYPWPGKGYSDESVNQLKRYLPTTRPLLIATFGLEVCKRARSNFIHDLGLSRSHYFASTWSRTSNPRRRKEKTGTKTRRLWPNHCRKGDDTWRRLDFRLIRRPNE